MNQGNISITEVTFGGYVNATALFHMILHGDAFVSAEFMPLGNVTINGQGRRAELDLGSQVYISAGLNWPF